MIVLNRLQLKAHEILAGVAAGVIISRQSGTISYKELWERLSDEGWVRARYKTIVNIITTVSAQELQNGRPPLNELVVAIGKSEPTESWKNISAYLKTISGVTPKYRDHTEARRACQSYWKSSWQRWRIGENALANEQEVEEGLQQDRLSSFRRRNANLVAERKRLDKFTCQVCHFRLKVGDKYIIDCHHRNPLGNTDSTVVTSISDLVCLCPTCHRIAHSRRYPLSEIEIRSLLSRKKPRIAAA